MNFPTLLLIGLATVGQPGGDEQEPIIVVQCKADADIRGSEVLLRDLAHVKTDKLELTERLLQVSFGQRPAVGFSRVLTRQDVMLRLAREGVRAADMRVEGAPQVVLHPIVVRVQPQDLLDAADPVLRAALELEPDTDIEFESIGNLRSIMVPPGRYAMDLSASLRNGSIGHSSADVDLEILVDHEPFRTVRVPYRLRRYHEVLISNKAIARGDPLGDANLELRRVELGQGTSPYLTGFTAVQGKVAARDIQAGQKLVLAALADPAVVFKGDAVHLVSVSGRVQVTTRALALADGPVGARIPVRNLTAGKIVQAMVQSRGLVVVQLDAVMR